MGDQQLHALGELKISQPHGIFSKKFADEAALMELLRLLFQLPEDQPVVKIGLD